MNRRGFFGSLVAMVAGLLGFGKAKAETGFYRIQPTYPRGTFTVRGGILVDDKGRSGLKFQPAAAWPVDLWAYASEGLDRIAPWEGNPNPNETRLHLLRGMARDFEEFGRCLLWKIKNDRGVTMEVHRILATWWKTEKGNPRTLIFHTADIPTFTGRYGYTRAPHEVLVLENETEFVEIPKESWEAMRKM